MQETLNGIIGNNSLPMVTAFVLGLLTAISPCPLATNITAIGFVSKDVENKKKVFINGIIYTLGRALTYFGLALIIYLGADQFKVSGIFQKYGEKALGPLLVLIGLLMFDIIKIKFPGVSGLTQHFQKKGTKSYWDVLLLGVIFALAFCPYSGVLYFGMLVPMTISSVSGLYLPIVFAIATGIPVIIFAWLLAFTLSGVGNLYNNLKIFEIWFRRVISIVFIVVGIYYIVTIYF